MKAICCVHPPATQRRARPAPRLQATCTVGAACTTACACAGKCMGTGTGTCRALCAVGGACSTNATSCACPTDAPACDGGKCKVRVRSPDWHVLRHASLLVAHVHVNVSCSLICCLEWCRHYARPARHAQPTAPARRQPIGVMAARARWGWTHVDRPCIASFVGLSSGTLPPGPQANRFDSHLCRRCVQARPAMQAAPARPLRPLASMASARL